MGGGWGGDGKSQKVIHTTLFAISPKALVGACSRTHTEFTFTSKSSDAHANITQNLICDLRRIIPQPLVSVTVFHVFDVVISILIYTKQSVSASAYL